jgi:hypothetical protein
MQPPDPVSVLLAIFAIDRVGPAAAPSVEPYRYSTSREHARPATGPERGAQLYLRDRQRPDRLARRS